MSNKRDKKTPEQIAWEMFEKSGNPSYYLLYKKLNIPNMKKIRCKLCILFCLWIDFFVFLCYNVWWNNAVNR